MARLGRALGELRIDGVPTFPRRSTKRCSPIRSSGRGRVHDAFHRREPGRAPPNTRGRRAGRPVDDPRRGARRRAAGDHRPLTTVASAIRTVGCRREGRTDAHAASSLGKKLVVTLPDVVSGRRRIPSSRRTLITGGRGSAVSTLLPATVSASNGFRVRGQQLVQSGDGQAEVRAGAERPAHLPAHGVRRLDLPGRMTQKAQSREQIVKSQITGKVLKVMVKVNGRRSRAGNAAPHHRSDEDGEPRLREHRRQGAHGRGEGRRARCRPARAAPDRTVSAAQDGIGRASRSGSRRASASRRSPFAPGTLGSAPRASPWARPSAVMRLTGGGPGAVVVIALALVVDFAASCRSVAWKPPWAFTTTSASSSTRSRARPSPSRSFRWQSCRTSRASRCSAPHGHRQTVADRQDRSRG